MMLECNTDESLASMHHGGEEHITLQRYAVLKGLICHRPVEVPPASCVCEEGGGWMKGKRK